MTKIKHNKRDIDGVLLLDKPKGMTSNEALQAVKRYFNAAKAGHTGSLDPIATGMLPLCFGEATKFSQFLLEADKKYIVAGKLGETTASGDSEGAVIATKAFLDVTAKKIEKILEQFRGKISQIPSMYSAIKYKGEPLYRLARQGIEVERTPREVTIHELKFLDYKDGLMHLAVHCSKGTYIRTLIADIGEVLGCGAHVIELRRLTVGPFLEKEMVSLETIKQLVEQKKYADLDLLLLPVDTMISNWNEIKLSDIMIFYARQGNPIVVPNAPTSGWVKLKDKHGKFIGAGEILLDGKVAPRRLIKSCK